MAGTTQLDKSTSESQWKEKLTDAEVRSCSNFGAAPRWLIGFADLLLPSTPPLLVVHALMLLMHFSW